MKITQNPNFDEFNTTHKTRFGFQYNLKIRYSIEMRQVFNNTFREVMNTMTNI